MSIVIVVSAPPDRQAYRSNDPRAAAILAEKAIWPLLKAGRKVNVIVQAEDFSIEQELRKYFADLIAAETAFLKQQIQTPGAEV